MRLSSKDEIPFVKGVPYSKKVVLLKAPLAKRPFAGLLFMPLRQV